MRDLRRCKWYRLEDFFRHFTSSLRCMTIDQLPFKGVQCLVVLNLDLASINTVANSLSSTGSKSTYTHKVEWVGSNTYAARRLYVDVKGVLMYWIPFENAVWDLGEQIADQ